MEKTLDKKEEKELLEKLGGLGLSEKESRVYLALLPRAGVGSSALIRATGLHGQFVYDALERLEDLGLATHAIQNGRKKFSANSPLLLLSLAEQKRTAALEASKMLQEWVGRSFEKQTYKLFQGNAAFAAHEIELLDFAPAGSTICIIGGTGDRLIEILKDLSGPYEEKRLEKSINIRYLGAPEQAGYLKIMAQQRQKFDFRLSPAVSQSVSNMEIGHDHMTLQFFGDPVLSFTLGNSQISNGYKTFFEWLWQTAS